MKALFIGVGSIGTRHICDFYEICKRNGILPEIHVLRRRICELVDDLQDKVTKQILQIEEDYDVAFITNPTNLHFEALKKVKGKTKFYFIEKPIFDLLSYDMNELDINEKNSYVAAPMRHTVIYKKLKEIIFDKKIYSSRIICSSYLPEWRPNIDYRNNYSAKKNMGGGVSLDLIHEIDYMVDLFGFPRRVSRVCGKYSDLEIDSDDLSVYIADFGNMICEIHLDYFGREYRRQCEIFTDEGTYIADFKGEVINCPDGNIVNCKDVDSGEFKNEMEYFYGFISGAEVGMNSPQRAIKTLEIAIGDNLHGEEKCNNYNMW